MFYCNCFVLNLHHFPTKLVIFVILYPTFKSGFAQGWCCFWCRSSSCSSSSTGQRTLKWRPDVHRNIEEQKDTPSMYQLQRPK